MRDARLVQLFERYRSRGDAEALAKVFDEVAPALLKVARHIDGRTGEAEDLVQTTFLVAIERASAFDVTRPLVPWLMGILINQSRLARRRRSRIDECGPEETRADTDLGLDLENREFATAVVGALRELPEVYQQVLLPHLTQGMKPGEIAERLGRPHGTVRAQIHRGIRMIRRSLPSGFALGWAATTGDLASLAEVRAEILRVAREETQLARRSAENGANDVTWSSGRSVIRKCALASMAALLCVAAWIFLRDARAAEPALIAAAPAVAPVRKAENVRSSEHAVEGNRSRAATENAAAEIEPYGEIMLQVMTAKDHVAAPGRQITVLAWEEAEWYAHVIETVTGIDGTVLLPRVHAGRVGIHVDHGPQKRETVVGGQRLDVKLELPRGVDVTGRVVDLNGHPIAGATVEACDRVGDSTTRLLDDAALREVVRGERDGPERVSDVARTAEERRPSRSRQCTTRSDGSFGFSDVDRKLFLFARAPGQALSELYWLDSPRYRASESIELAIVLGEPGLRLSGRVLDPRGNPVADARVVITRADARSSAVDYAASEVVHAADAIRDDLRSSARAGADANGASSGQAGGTADRPSPTPSPSSRTETRSSAGTRSETRAARGVGATGSDARSAEPSTASAPSDGESAAAVAQEEPLEPAPSAATPAARARARCFADGSVRIDESPLCLSTDAHGRFATDSLAAGPVTVQVEARGFAPSSTSLDIDASHVDELVVHVTQGVAVRGTVRMSDGRPAEDAVVTARSPALPSPQMVRTGPSGDFALEHLPPGEIVLAASAHGFGEPTSATFTSREGESVSWEPLVEPTQTIEGTVIGAGGKQVAIWLVKAVPEDRDSSAHEDTFEHWIAQAIFGDPAPDVFQCRTNDRGEFRVPCRGRAQHRLELRPRLTWTGAPHATLSGVSPGTREVVMRYTPNGSTIRGRLVLPHGAAATACPIIAIEARDGSAAHFTSDPSTGEFKLDRLPKGSYELIAWPAGCEPQSLGRHEVSHGATLDLGLLRLSRSE